MNSDEVLCDSHPPLRRIDDQPRHGHCPQHHGKGLGSVSLFHVTSGTSTSLECITQSEVRVLMVLDGLPCTLLAVRKNNYLSHLTTSVALVCVFLFVIYICPSPCSSRHLSRPPLSLSLFVQYSTVNICYRTCPYRLFNLYYLGQLICRDLVTFNMSLCRYLVTFYM